MNTFSARKSWDTSVKHLARHGVLEDILSPSQIRMIPSSNISRWKHESEDKYLYCEINTIIKKEVEFIKRVNQTSKIKKFNESYFKLQDTFHQIIANVKGIKTIIRKHRDVSKRTVKYIL